MNYYNEKHIDIPSEIIRSRVIYLDGEVNEDLATAVCKQLLYLDNEDSEKPIQLFINSPGGSVLDGLAIINTMNSIKAPVYTCVYGLAASMGAAILSCGEIGHRYAYPRSKVMVHRVSSGTQGNIQDMRVSLKFSEDLDAELTEMIATNCGMRKADYEKATERDKWLNAKEASEFGIIDEILKNTDKEKKRAEALKERFKKK